MVPVAELVKEHLEDVGIQVRLDIVVVTYTINA